MKKPFRPDFLPIKLTDREIIEVLKIENEARTKIERFNSILERSPIKRELLMLFTMNESVQSTRIEGTQASFSDVIKAEATGKKNKDTVEVLNYFEALKQVEVLLDQIPISNRMFFKLHKTLLTDSRGRNRSPGEYRKVQNFVGPTNNIKDATYIPPEPHLVYEYMHNLERYINDEYEDDFGTIARAGIIHGQFETIHPFLDGNGRIGRILIMIYLLDKKVISSPTFFVSEELEKSKHKYYALLNGLRLDKPQWKNWLIFFLDAYIKQADKYIEKLITVESLYNNLSEFAKSENIKKDAILFIFRSPIFTIKRMQKELGVSYNTAKRYTSKLEKGGKIYSDDKKRNRNYMFYDLIGIFNRF